MPAENRIFLPGVLCHPDISQVVLGNTKQQPALLHGFAGEAFAPGVWPDKHAVLHGGLIVPPDAETRDRVAFYCAVFGAEPALVEVALADGTNVMAQTHVIAKPGERFEMPETTEAVWIRMADEVMRNYNRLPADYVAERLPDVLRRATSYVASQAMPVDPERDLTRDVVVQQHQQPYMNFFTVEETDLQFRRYDGALSDVVNRGALHVGQVVAVLPYDPVRDSVLLVEQFRAAVYMSGNPAPWMWQPVAGLIDPGETPIQAAHREAAEEAGLVLSRLMDAGQAYSSPGSSTEYVYMYVGLADLGNTRGIGGLAEENEDIRSRVLSFEALMQALDSNQFHDLPLLCLAQWLARHRDRLRLMA